MNNKALNKEERFVCEMVWGGVTLEANSVRDSRFFQDGMTRFQNDEWKDLWKQETNRDYKPDNLLEWFSKYYNRSLSQCGFLLELCDRNYMKLRELEVQLRDKHVFYCPADKEEMTKVMTFTKDWRKNL
tara:strand:- start:11381 stop:11767 length:387 start_codon:yes stop_codon:yes gene_type:complete